MERFYQLLDAIGFTHPIHPVVKEISVGLVIGAFLLGVISLLFRLQMAGRAARYCMIVAFIFMFPAMLLGYTDWQHYFGGGWLNPIKIKLILAGILLVLAFIAIVAGRKDERTSSGVALLYTLCVVCVLGLGFFGGQLVYSGKVPVGPAEFRTGEKLFRANCSGCHPYGGNIVDPKAELRGSDELKDLQTFIRWIRDPILDNGAKGAMPPFFPARMSDAQAKELLAYIVKAMGPAKPVPACDVTIPTVAVRTDQTNVAKGKQLFEANCIYCHTVAGTETLVGPGLKGIMKRKTLPFGDWPATPENIFRQLRCPYKDMPSFKEKLTDDQVFDLISFLNTE
ncbi:MAG TPA: c-type cytochrome [Syntrophorhabdales bacterium]|nr:c-type cytochrome [Syntrophorhabdales bacterium]